MGKTKPKICPAPHPGSPKATKNNKKALKRTPPPTAATNPPPPPPTPHHANFQAVAEISSRPSARVCATSSWTSVDRLFSSSLNEEFEDGLDGLVMICVPLFA